MNDIFLGRQPIFDRHRDVFAYELLFRSRRGQRADIAPGGGDRATSAVFAHTVLDIGTAHVMHGLPAFVNLGRGFLLERRRLPMSPDELVIEVLEDVPPETAVIERLKGLSRQGYRLALDDFQFHDRLQPLLELADIIKLDVQALDRPSLEEHVRLGRLAGKKLLAEKVESFEELEWCHVLGFDYFQGYFLCRPDLVRGRSAGSVPLANLVTPRTANRWAPARRLRPGAVVRPE